MQQPVRRMKKNHPPKYEAERKIGIITSHTQNRGRKSVCPILRAIRLTGNAMAGKSNQTIKALFATTLSVIFLPLNVGRAQHMHMEKPVYAAGNRDKTENSK